MRHLLLRPILIISIVLGLFVIGEAIIIGGLTWRNHQRLKILEQDIRNGHQLESRLFVLLHRGIDNNQAFYGTEKTEEITDIEQLQEQHPNLEQTLLIAKKIFSGRARKEERLLTKIAEDSQLEFKLALILPVILCFILYFTGHYFFKKNVLAPLDSLKELLQMLARGDRQPIRQQTADPVMRALFDNYNRLVIRLTELEKEHLDYTTQLEQKVRQTTSALLEQSHQIARSERLSVVAELAASTAHELRNPLAGIHLALENILQECNDTDLHTRLNAVNDEVKRLTQHLNDLLALTRASSHLPETVDINQICNELRDFLKYQIPKNINLEYDIEPSLQVRLPLTEFRLALLNLLLNAIQAIGSQQGHIQLCIHRRQEQINILIQDSGPGFAETLLHNGIRPFVSLKEQGTGLGLATVQRFIKSQQGTIRLYNNEQGHACVLLTLPALMS